MDALGRSVVPAQRVRGGTFQFQTDLPAGAYSLIVTERNGTRKTLRLVIAR